MDEFELMTRPPPDPPTPPKRLPTLFEILSRKTLAPLDLFSFYIYMRDQQRSVDYLDFWLDVVQHLSLCRLYVRELHRMIIAEDPQSESSTQAQARLMITPVTTPFLGQTPADGSTIRREDISASAEKILYTYILPGSEREIILPQSITSEIIRAIESEGRHDPEVFDSAKDYVFQAMERDALPGFLQAKAIGNLTPVNIVLRVIAGFIVLFGGLWTAFALVFLNYSKQQRCWIILPLLFANYCLVSYAYTADPILGIFGYSEYTFLDFNRIRDPFVRRLTFTRSVVSFLVIMILTSAICLPFILVPGPKRRVQRN